MKNNKKIIAIYAVLLVAVALAIVAVFRTDREELTEDVINDVVEEEFNETETLDVVGTGDDLADIEADLVNLDEELELTLQDLDQLDTELEGL